MVLDKAFSSGQNINGFQRCGSEPSSPCEKTKIDSSLPFHFKSPSAKHCNYNQPQRPKCNSLNSSNCSTNKTFISAHELAAEMEKSPLELLILDCRSQIRYDLAHIATSINVDVNELVSPNSYEPINCNNNNKNNVQKCNSNYYDDNEENSGDMNNNNNNNITSTGSHALLSTRRINSTSKRESTITLPKTPTPEEEEEERESDLISANHSLSSPVLLQQHPLTEEYMAVASSPKFEVDETPPPSASHSILTPPIETSSPSEDCPILCPENIHSSNHDNHNTHNDDQSTDRTFDQIMLKSLENFSVSQFEKSLPSYEDRILFRQREFCHVIVYDDGVPDNNPELALTTYSPAFIMHTLLKNEGYYINISILQGGYENFAECYQFMCDPPVNCGIDTSFLPSLEERLNNAHNRIFQSLTREIRCDMPSKIFSHLYLGDAQNSFNLKQLQKLKIRHIINTAGECENHHPQDLSYDKFHLVDNEHENVKKYFEDAFIIIEQCRKQKRRVLVHCFMGISRSVSIVIAYIMKYKQWTLKKAYSYVREKRKIMDPNIGFMKQLFAYEKELFGFTSLPLYFLEPVSDS